MNIETKILELEKQIEEAKRDLKPILMDIRTYIMEADTPIPNDLDRERLREELEASKEV